MRMEKLFDAEGITSSERFFYTPSSFARKHLCYVQEAGTLKSLKPHVSSREDLESFLFFIVKSGCGMLRYEEKQIELKSGEAVLIDCRKHYEQESSVTSPWELAWIHFDGAKAEALYPLFWKENGSSARIVLGRQETEEAVLGIVREDDLPGAEVPKAWFDYLKTNDFTLIGKILESKGENSLENEIRADAVIGDLLLLCMQQAMADEKEAPRFEGLRETLNESMKQVEKGMDFIRISLEEAYGAKFEQIDAAFQERYGISVEGYVTNRILNKAKELLRFTIKPLNEVAAESGIGDEEKLHRLFLEQEELSPEEYRKRWAQWIKG